MMLTKKKKLKPNLCVSAEHQIQTAVIPLSLSHPHLSLTLPPSFSHPPRTPSVLSTECT